MLSYDQSILTTALPLPANQKFQSHQHLCILPCPGPLDVHCPLLYPLSSSQGRLEVMLTFLS